MDTHNKFYLFLTTVLTICAALTLFSIIYYVRRFGLNKFLQKQNQKVNLKILISTLFFISSMIFLATKKLWKITIALGVTLLGMHMNMNLFGSLFVGAIISNINNNDYEPTNATQIL